MAITFNPFSGAGSISNESTRQDVYGNVAFTSNYITGGLVPNWSNLTDTAGQSVILSADQVGQGFNITQIGVTSNVATILAVNTLTVGQSVIFNSANGNAAPLNGVTALVSNLSNIGFTVPFVTANFGNVPVTGVAALVIGPSDFWPVSVAGSGNTYVYNKANASVQVFSGNVQVANNTPIVDTITALASYVRS
jgi:hypothetical protein